MRGAEHAGRIGQGAHRDQGHIAQCHLLEGERECGLRRIESVHADYDRARRFIDRPPPATNDRDPPPRMPGYLPGNRSKPQPGNSHARGADHDHLGGAAALAQHVSGGPADKRRVNRPGPSADWA